MIEYADELASSTRPPVNRAFLPVPTGRLAIAGDWHANLKPIVTALIAAHQAGVTVIVHVGDFGDTYEPKLLAVMQLICAELGITVYFVRGNHDSTDRLRTMPIIGRVRPLTPNIIHLPDGVRWEWFGKTWIALGGALTYNRALPIRVEGVNWWRDEGLHPLSMERAIAEGHADVVISHESPKGANTPMAFEAAKTGWIFEYDNLAHRRLLAQFHTEHSPALWLHGHYHVRYSDLLSTTRIEGLSFELEPDQNLVLLDPHTLEVTALPVTDRRAS